MIDRKELADRKGKGVDDDWGEDGRGSPQRAERERPDHGGSRRLTLREETRANPFSRFELLT